MFKIRELKQPEKAINLKMVSDIKRGIFMIPAFNQKKYFEEHKPILYPDSFISKREQETN